MKVVLPKKLSFSQLRTKLTGKHKFRSLGRYQCGREIVSDDIPVYEIDGDLSFGGLATCKSPWTCPVCRHAILSKRQEEISFINDFWMGKYQVYYPKTSKTANGHQQHNWTACPNLETLPNLDRDVLLVTLTIPHGVKDRLQRLLGSIQHKSGMAYAKHKMFRMADFRKRAFLTWLEHYICGLEVTWSERNGYHPHYHILTYVNKNKMPPEFFQENGDYNFEEISNFFWQNWAWACAEVGLGTVSEKAIDVRLGRDAGSYIAKWSSAHEVSSQHLKKSVSGYSMGELEQMDAQGLTTQVQHNALQHYYQATYRFKMLTYSNSLKAIRQFYKFSKPPQSKKTIGHIQKDIHKQLRNHQKKEFLRKLFKSKGRLYIDKYLRLRYGEGLADPHIFQTEFQYISDDELARMRFMNDMRNHDRIYDSDIEAVFSLHEC